MADISFGFDNPLKVRFGDEFFKELPQKSGVYTFLDRKGRPLYIGKADNLKRRLLSYQAAKPGQAADHILEMIEHAHDLRYEILPSSEASLRREEELIRSVRPRYNIALNYDVSYLYVGFRVQEFARVVSRDRKLNLADGAKESAKIEFRLSHMDIHEGFTSFGCFRHRGKAKGGYSALLRLLFAAHCPRERFLIPAKLCRSSPAYNYVLELPVEVLEPLEDFLSGKNKDLLRYLLETLLLKPDLPKQLYIPLQRDFETAKEFFQYGPQDTRKLARKLRSGDGKVAQEILDDAITNEFRVSISQAAFTGVRTTQKTQLKTRPKSRPKTQQTKVRAKA